MSGGSYDYLCFADSSNIGGRDEDVAKMANRLAELGNAPAATAATRRIQAMVAELDAAIADLSDLWHDVEWCDSGDYGDDQLAAAVAAYEAAHDTPPVAP